MSRVKTINCKKRKDEFDEEKDKEAVEDEVDEEEKYICIERKGRPGVLSDDWNASSEIVDLYEYLISHESEAA